MTQFWRGGLTILGCMFVGLAILGVFLPLLPTTPFLLLAAACFVRSSPALHEKLLASPVLGQYLRDFQERRGLPLRAKVLALGMMWASISFAILQIPDLLAKLLLLAVALGVSAYLLSLKTLED